MNGSRDDMIVLLVGGMDVSVLTKVIQGHKASGPSPGINYIIVQGPNGKSQQRSYIILGV